MERPTSPPPPFPRGVHVRFITNQRAALEGPRRGGDLRIKSDL